MNGTKLFLLGLACVIGSGCGSLLTESNYFLTTEPDAAQARIKKPNKPPPYTATEAQDAVTVLVVRQFSQDAARAIGSPVREVYFGIGPEHADPDAALANRLNSSGLRIRPLSQGARAEVRTATSGTPVAPDLRVAFALETLDLIDHYTAVVTGVWSVGGGPVRNITYRYQYSSGRWTLIR